MRVKNESNFNKILKIIPKLSIEEQEKLIEEIKKIANENKNKKRPFGLLKGQKFWISEDFDEPLEEFKDYM